MNRKKWLSCLFVLITLCVSLVFSACQKEDGAAAEKKPEKETEVTAEEQISVEDFCNKVKGFWFNKSESGELSIVSFENGTMDDFVYCSEYSIKDGVIKDAKEDGAVFEIKVEYREDSHGNETEGTLQETTFSLSSNDDFRRKLILVRDNGVSLNYEYIGATYDEAEAILEDIGHYEINNTTDSKTPAGYGMSIYDVYKTRETLVLSYVKSQERELEEQAKNENKVVDIYSEGTTVVFETTLLPYPSATPEDKAFIKDVFESSESDMQYLRSSFEIMKKEAPVTAVRMEIRAANGDLMYEYTFR
ncbi:MAG: hypothetical protein IKB50_01420 [Clostridia bacterium]|nr:hypothetical protein [Clostridia bacterium]